MDETEPEMNSDFASKCIFSCYKKTQAQKISNVSQQPSVDVLMHKKSRNYLLFISCQLFCCFSKCCNWCQRRLCLQPRINTFPAVSYKTNFKM